MDTSKTGARIKELRKKHGMKQDELAEKLLGISTERGGQTISEYENGKNIPPLSKIQKLAEILECDADYLLGSIDHPDITTSWIAEQIPLSRDSIDKLIMLNDAISSDESSFKDAFNMIAGMIDSLIIEIIPEHVSPYEFRDSTGRKSSDLFNSSYKLLKAAKYLNDQGINLDKNHVSTIHDYIKRSEMRGSDESVKVENAQLSIDANAVRIGSILGDIVADYLISHREEA